MALSGPTLDTQDRQTDLVFDILSSPRRRAAVRLLYEHQDSIRTLQDLAAHLAALENDVPIEALSHEQRKRVYVSLYQTHIPKLQETGLVRFDRGTGTLRLTNRIVLVGRYLDLPARPDPVHRIYLLVTVLGALFLSAVVLDLPLFSMVPDPLAAFVVVSSLVVIAGYLFVWARPSLVVPPDTESSESAPDR